MIINKNLILLCFLTAGLLFIYNCNRNTGVSANSDKLTESTPSLNSLEEYSFNKYKGKINIKINPLIELDFKTKEEIYELRKKQVSLYPELVDKTYIPSEIVFGHIVDNKPWWGILGIYYYGHGEKCIEGPSADSQFINNPFLLIGLRECYAYRVCDLFDTPVAFPPKPLGLIWNGEKSEFEIKYNVSDHFRNKIKYKCFDDNERKLFLIAYNARDLGFNYLYLDPGKSKNVSSSNKSGESVKIEQFIHCGENTGYPGGCNNMSPYQNELIIEIGNTPAIACINLWKERPEKVNNKSDLVVIIEII